MPGHPKPKKKKPSAMVPAEKSPVLRGARRRRDVKEAAEQMQNVLTNGTHARASMMWWRRRIESSQASIEDIEILREYYRNAIRPDSNVSERVRIRAAEELRRMTVDVDNVAGMLAEEERHIMFNPGGSSQGVEAPKKEGDDVPAVASRTITALISLVEATKK